MKQLWSLRSSLLSKICRNPVCWLSVVVCFLSLVGFVVFTRAEDVFPFHFLSLSQGGFPPRAAPDGRWTGANVLPKVQKPIRVSRSPKVHQSACGCVHGAEHSPGDGNQAPSTSNTHLGFVETLACCCLSSNQGNLFCSSWRLS